MPDDKQIPYEEPTLRNAYRRGWEAWVQGRVRPERHSLGKGNWARAWLEGYIAAKDGDAKPPKA